MATGGKDPGAFLTIGELSDTLGVAQHILRYWESKFPQLKPLKRAGNRRYYRPSDVATAQRINQLLNSEGYTIKGAQKALRQGGNEDQPQLAPTPIAAPSEPAVDLAKLKSIRDRLRAALDA